MRLKQLLFCWLGLLINLTANALDLSVNGIKYSTTIDGVEAAGYSNIDPYLVLDETATYAGRLPDGIQRIPETITADNHKTELGRYNLNGQQTKKGEKGIQIVRYSDGTSRKVLIK